MNIGGQQIPLSMLLLLALAAVWMLALLAGIISWEKGRGRLRATDIVVLVISLIAGGVWMFALLPREASATPAANEAAAVPKRIATCAVIEAGESESSVRKRLGDPDEIRSEEELRGPGADVWIYRDSRCAVHFISDRVESIE
jgi:hypothetical protein